MRMHEHLRKLCELCRAVVDSVPQNAKTGSPRRIERSGIVSSGSYNARPLRELVDEVNTNAQLMLAYLTMLIEGVADCFEVAASRGNELNGAALSATVRPCLEVSGQIAWLLDERIDGADRGRRLLVWQLADLRQQRLLTGTFRPSAGRELAKAEFDREETRLLDQAAAIGWAFRPTVYRGEHLEAGALLDSSGTALKMPAYSHLIPLVTSGPALYGLLSVSVHSNRFGVLHSVDTTHADGMDEVRISSFGVPPEQAIMATTLALTKAASALARWTGVGDSRVTNQAKIVLQVAGVLG